MRDIVTYYISHFNVLRKVDIKLWEILVVKIAQKDILVVIVYVLVIINLLKRMKNVRGDIEKVFMLMTPL